MSNSPLVTYTKLTKHCNSPRNHIIDTITIHCVVGQWTAKQGCDYFASTTRKASCNYVVGKDGSIGLCVNEADRSWCTSSATNDNRAVTIEVASDTTAPYAVTTKAYDALIELVADICKRNNIKKLLWQNDKTLIGQVAKQNMTVHRWFANKACPGDYLYERHADIADAVNKKLNATPSTVLHRVQVGAYSKKANANTCLANVKTKGFDGYIVQVGSMYKVQVGAYAQKANATAMLAKLKAAGFKDAMLTTQSGTPVSSNAATTTKPLTVGSTVRVNAGAKTYTGGNIASFVYARNHTVHSINGERVVISYGGVIIAAINKKDLTVV